MKVVLKKRPAPPPPAKPAARSYRTVARPADDGMGRVKWIFIAILVVLFAAAAVAYGVARKRHEEAIRRAQQAQRAAGPARPGQVPGGILGDFDMKAWCQEHDKDNAELQARRARMHGGATQQPSRQP